MTRVPGFTVDSAISWIESLFLYYSMIGQEQHRHDIEGFIFVDYISKILVVWAGIFCLTWLVLDHVNINSQEDCMKNGYFSGKIFILVVDVLPIPVATWSEAWVCGCWLAGGKDVCLLWV
jgi:hypothetical protein